MNRLVALVGMCGAGKSVVTKAFCDKGFSPVYFGGVTMDELQRLSLEKNEKNERMVREQLRKTLGPAAFAIQSLPKIKKALALGDTVIDGLYSWSEYKVLRDAFPSLLVIAVVTDRAKRYDRLADRPERPLSYDEAQSRDIAEIEHSEKGGPIAFADRYLVNNGTEEDLKHNIEALFDTLSF